MTRSREPRLPYAAPALESLGSIRELTQTGGNPNTSPPDGASTYGPGAGPGS
jgi:hypothetical protein